MSMNCVSFVVMFYLLELILKTQVSNTMNTVGISWNDKYLLLLLLLLQLMFKVPSISTHAGSQTSTPLIHCRTDDVVIQVAPLLYQSLHLVVDVTDVAVDVAGPKINLLINWFEVLTIRRPLQRRGDIWHFTAQHLNSFTGTVGRSVVLLECEEFAIHVLLAMVKTAIFDHLFNKM